jgi:HSP20 family protein
MATKKKKATGGRKEIPVGKKTKKDRRSEESAGGSLAKSLNGRESFSGNPFELVRRFHEEMERALELHPVMGGGVQGTGRAAFWAPPVEVLERDGKMVVRVELSGLARKDIKVTVGDGSLVIEGERKQEKEERKEGLYRSERSYGRFYRQVPLPAHADSSLVRARFEDGLLEVSVPIPDGDSQRREVEVEEGRGPAAVKPGDRGPGPSAMTF